MFFESDFEKGFLSNGSHFYKNAYKVFSFENISNESVGVKMFFLVVSKRATRSESTYSKDLKCSFPPPLDVVILPLF